MTIIQTPLDGCFLIKPSLFKDSRGYFYESFNEEKFNRLSNNEIHFVQDNQSYSSSGALRGLHFQKGDCAQAKLVQVLKGKVLDVAVDLREGSCTFGKHFSYILDSKDKVQLFIPRGFAHGFVVLSAEAEFFYKCDNYYNKASEGGIKYDDKDLAIDWKLPKSQLVISEKDQQNPSFKELYSLINF